MKVLLAPEYARFGGTLSFFLRLLNIHKKHKIKSAVLLEPGQQTPRMSICLRSDGVQVLKKESRPRLAYHPLFAWLKDLRIIRQGVKAFPPDLIVVSNGTPGIMLGALIFPVPVLYIMHTYSPGKFLCLYRFVWWLLSLHRKNRFVTVSQYAAHKIQSSMGISRNRITVIYNSYEKQVPHDLSDAQMVLTCGHVANYKNPEAWFLVAVQVISQRPGVKFVWLGDGPLLEDMRRKVDTAGFGESVVFAGFQDDVETYLSQTRVYFQPSLIENHAISILDAMASGVPCVASNVGGTPESIIDRETGYLCAPDDVAGFTDALLELLDNAELSMRMGAAGRVRAEKIFTSDAQEKGLLDIYSNMMRCS